jgi:tRNA1(Val) A37 N6-methylase TrmN6
MVLTVLFENERLDKVNDDLSLIQKKGGLLFGTDALLLAGYVSGEFGFGIEFGGGSGIISMLLLSRGKLSLCDTVEAQEEYAHLIERNAKLNSLEQKMRARFADVREYTPNTDADVVFTNPPYMKTSSGKQCENSAKNIARHEVCGDIRDFLIAAKRMLKFGGAFYAVYRPDRLVDLIFAMRECEIEPKRATFVHASPDSEASMVLIEGRRGGKPGLKLTKPFLIYNDSEHKIYTEDMDYVMREGSFPDEFNITNVKRKIKIEQH